MRYDRSTYRRAPWIRMLRRRQLQHKISKERLRILAPITPVPSSRGHRMPCLQSGNPTFVSYAVHEQLTTYWWRFVLAGGAQCIAGTIKGVWFG